MEPARPSCPVHISYRTEDGAEHEEQWPSIERFRVWAAANQLRCTWSAYEEDDGDLVLIERGRT